MVSPDQVRSLDAAFRRRGMREHVQALAQGTLPPGLQIADGLVWRLVLAATGVVLVQVFFARLIQVPLMLLLRLLAIPLRLVPGRKESS